MNLFALFLVALAAVGYETALIRYFAVSKWSEYGYWVISIVMVGFALSGVVLAIWRDAFVRRSDAWMTWLPAALVVTAGGGFFLTCINPFNPLQLQNPATWESQIWLIAAYYGSLLPFFFLTGVFISLCFILQSRRIGLVYGFDLTGAALGSASVLVLMFLVHPFDLVPLLLVPLAASALFVAVPRRLPAVLGVLVALLGTEALLILDKRAEINDFKAIYAPLHTQDAAVVAEARTPRGHYLLLDNFTERVDTDISNNAGMMGIDGPPRAYGLYRDGNRIAALPMAGGPSAAHVRATLAAAPYELVPRARVLLIGASGGFRIAEVEALNASQMRVLEPEPILARALNIGLGPSPPITPNPLVRVLPMSPLQAGIRGVYDIVDVSADFMDAADSNVTALTVEAIAGYLHVLAPNGMVSLPASIRDFPVYALRLLNTVRAALLREGVVDPSRHVVIYRSAWSVRILVSMVPWTTDRIARIRAFAEARSFDLSWYPGMDTATDTATGGRPTIFNDLPAVSLDQGTVSDTGPSDAIADEAAAILAGQDSPSRRGFNLAPITLDKPFWYALPRLDQLGTILQRLEILPQPEVGVVVNVAVLAQASLIALLVVLLPVWAAKRLRNPVAGLARAVVFFPCLGLGFLFIEICVIEKASLWLNDRTTGFAIVLTTMLLFSGLGSMMADRFRTRPHRAMAWAGAFIVIWVLAAILWLDTLILYCLSDPPLRKVAILVGILAPVSFALGMPFPLGLGRTGDTGYLPWAWGLNGAFSVVATPLANLLAREYGYSRVLLAAAILYALATIAFPTIRKTQAWQSTPSRSTAAP